MSYLAFIIVFSAIALAGFSIAGAFFKRELWRFDKRSLFALIVFYPLYWAGDALAVHLGFYAFNPAHLLGLWIGGIPLEDHVAGICGFLWMRCLFALFSKQLQ